MNQNQNITNLNWFERSSTQSSVGMLLEFAQLADSFYSIFYLVQSSGIDQVRRNGKHEDLRICYNHILSH